jgi:TonB family protein
MDRQIKRRSNSPSKIPDSKAVMKITLIVSLLFHVFLLLGIQKAFPINWFAKPLQTYRVELIRLPADSLEDEGTAGTDLQGIKPHEKLSPGETEDTISLDTKDKRYSSYAKIVKERLMRQLRYPREAQENLIEGKVLVLFTLNSQGRLRDVKILYPSLYGVLDGESVRAIQVAAPFPPFPSSVTVGKLHIKAYFDYRLTSRQ